MPRSVPLRILSRRRQQVRLLAAVLFAFGIGVTVHLLRPGPTTQVRYEVIGALIALSVTLLVMLLQLRRIAYVHAATVLALEATAIWASFAAGVLVVSRAHLGEVLIVSAICWAFSLTVGLVILAAVQHARPPRRALTCPTCEYDLRRTSGETCPECGGRFQALCLRCGAELDGATVSACPECTTALTPETIALHGRASER